MFFTGDVVVRTKDRKNAMEPIHHAGAIFKCIISSKDSAFYGTGATKDARKASFLEEEAFVNYKCQNINKISINKSINCNFVIGGMATNYNNDRYCKVAKELDIPHNAVKSNYTGISKNGNIYHSDDTPWDFEGLRFVDFNEFLTHVFNHWVIVDDFVFREKERKKKKTIEDYMGKHFVYTDNPTTDYCIHSIIDGRVIVTWNTSCTAKYYPKEILSYFKKETWTLAKLKEAKSDEFAEVSKEYPKLTEFPKIGYVMEMNEELIEHLIGIHDKFRHKSARHKGVAWHERDYWFVESFSNRQQFEVHQLQKFFNTGGKDITKKEFNTISNIYKTNKKDERFQKITSNEVCGSIKKSRQQRGKRLHVHEPTQQIKVSRGPVGDSDINS